MAHREELEALAVYRSEVTEERHNGSQGGHCNDVRAEKVERSHCELQKDHH